MCDNQSASNYRDYVDSWGVGEQKIIIGFCNDGSYTVDKVTFYINVNGVRKETYEKTSNLLGWDDNGWFVQIDRDDIEGYFDKEWQDITDSDLLNIDFKFKPLGAKAKNCTSVSLYPGAGDKRGIRVRATKSLANRTCKVSSAE